MLSAPAVAYMRRIALASPLQWQRLRRRRVEEHSPVRASSLGRDYTVDGETYTVTWDGTNPPAGWGHTRGLLLTDEGAGVGWRYPQELGAPAPDGPGLRESERAPHDAPLGDDGLGTSEPPVDKERSNA